MAAAPNTMAMLLGLLQSEMNRPAPQPVVEVDERGGGKRGARGGSLPPSYKYCGELSVPDRVDFAHKLNPRRFTLAYLNKSRIEVSQTNKILKLTNPINKFIGTQSLRLRVLFKNKGESRSSLLR